jgi:S-adenosylmethionine-dependent methyltransferase
MAASAYKHYDEIAEHYEEDYLSDPYWRLYHDITWLNIKKHLPKDKKSIIADIGGGTGFWSRKLAKLGYNVVCIDISENMLNVGRKKARKEGLQKKILFAYGDVKDLKDQKANSFGFVLCEGDPVSYCGNEGRAVSELARIAEPGAKVIVSVDNFYSVIRAALNVKMLGILPNIIKTHRSNLYGKMPQYNFTVEELKGLFKKNKLDVISIIGKPVFAHKHLFRDCPEYATDKKLYNQLLDLEMKFNSEPSLVSAGGHLEVVAKKL